MLKLGDCEGLRVAALQSPTLESLQLSQCRWLERVQLDCPMLTQASRAGLDWVQAVGWVLGHVSATGCWSAHSCTALCSERKAGMRVGGAGIGGRGCRRTTGPRHADRT